MLHEPTAWVAVLNLVKNLSWQRHCRKVKAIVCLRLFLWGLMAHKNCLRVLHCLIYGMVLYSYHTLFVVAFNAVFGRLSSVP